MKQVRLWVGVVITWFFLMPALSLGQEPGQEEPSVPLVSSEEAQLQTDWTWAQVLKVDLENKELQVKYLDYENDTEKEMRVRVDEKTIFENAQSISDIKAGDSVGLDYIRTEDDAVLALQIDVEKFDQEGVDEDEPMPPAGE